MIIILIQRIVVIITFVIVFALYKIIKFAFIAWNSLSIGTHNFCIINHVNFKVAIYTV